VETVVAVTCANSLGVGKLPFMK